MVFRIELAGGVATGKSTLCEAFKRRGFAIIPENLAENHYLSRQYNDQASRGFDVKMAFLVSKASAIDTWQGAESVAVCDYALVAEYAYAEEHLKSVDPATLELIRRAVDLRRKQVGDPDLLIHLECPVEEQLERIKGRGRDFERGYTAEYLKAINDGIRRDVETKMSLGCHRLFIDTDKNDISAPVFMNRLMPQIATIMMP